MVAQDGVLEPGEKILWEGRPRQGLMLRSNDTYRIPFSLVWCGFAIFWEYNALLARHNVAAPALNFMSFWGVPFVLVGLYAAIGRFFYDAFVRYGTNYALTNQRVLISAGGFSRELRSLMLDGLIDLRLSEGYNGRGTIKFGPDPVTNGRGFGSRSWSGGGDAPALEGIEDVRGVYRRILAAQKVATANQQ
ncbi:MAG TPA: PH domain-containing protein [Magnetospirillaceae bacterium]|jgi:hypothetical protein